MVLFRNVCSTSRCVRILHIVLSSFCCRLALRAPPQLRDYVTSSWARSHDSAIAREYTPADRFTCSLCLHEKRPIPPIRTNRSWYHLTSQQTHVASLSVTGPPGSLYCEPLLPSQAPGSFKTTAPKLPSISKPLQDLSAGESRSLSR